MATKRIMIRMKPGMGVLSPEKDDDGNLKHLGDDKDHDVPAVFGYNLVLEGRAVQVSGEPPSRDTYVEDDETPKGKRGR